MYFVKSARKEDQGYKLKGTLRANIPTKSAYSLSCLLLKKFFTAELCANRQGSITRESSRAGRRCPRKGTRS